jgi:Signal transduction histidine kinase
MISAILATAFVTTVLLLILFYYLNKSLNKINNDLYFNSELVHVFGANIDNVFLVYNAVCKRLEYISPNLEKTLELSRDALINENEEILHYIPDEKRNELRRMFQDTGHIEMLDIDFEYIKPITKNKCWIMLRVYPVYKNNKLVKFICTTTDITKEKLYQITLEETLSKLNMANEAKKKFLSHMSHELKTPINAMVGMAHIGLNSLEDKTKTINCLQKIDYCSKILLTLINNILDLAKLDSDKLVLFTEPFQMKQSLTSFYSIIKTQAELSFQKFEFIMEEIQDDYLIGDSLRLIQILQNCISNSIKFTPPGGEIKLKVTETERLADKACFCFVISDTGKGMSEEFLKNLFQAYEQEDQIASNRIGGTGIGMTITKELVELMEGSISVTSKVNIGTTYTINISFQINSTLTSDLSEKTVNMKPVSPYDFTGKRILVVEDNEVNIEIAVELLKQINFNVDTARSGYEAIRLFEKSERGYYDIILMDLQMPEQDGYETAKAIRSSAHPDAGTINIIALTADDFSEEQKSLDCGMNYHIRKSIQSDNYYTTLQKAMMNKENFRKTE